MGASTSPSISGAILLFEANATMVVEQPDGDPCWDYRRAAVERIHAAVRDLLLTRAGLKRTSEGNPAPLASPGGPSCMCLQITADDTQITSVSITPSHAPAFRARTL